MPANVFQQVKGINRDKNNKFFLTNTNLPHYQVFLKKSFASQSEKPTIKNCWDESLSFLNYEIFSKPLICICGQSDSCWHVKLICTTIHQTVTNNFYQTILNVCIQFKA